MWRYLLIIAFVSTFSSIAQANVNNDGSFFLRACGAAVKQADGAELSPNENIEALYCVSYVSGFVDSLVLSNLLGSQLVCIPESGVTNEQLIRIFVKYLRNTPEKLHESGRISLFISLKSTFACK